MEASGAEQHCFRPRMLPTDDWQAVVPVATGHFVQTAVLDCLRDHQQPRVADGEVEMKANFSISFIIGTRKGEVDLKCRADTMKVGWDILLNATVDKY